MSRPALLSLPDWHVLAAALVTIALGGCQSNRAVIPPPGSLMSQGDPYYNRPAGATLGAGPTTSSPATT